MTSSKRSETNGVDEEESNCGSQGDRSKCAGIAGHFVIMKVTSSSHHASSGIRNIWCIGVGWETSKLGTAEAWDCL